MKIFQMNENDWVAAESLHSAIQGLAEVFGNTVEEIKDEFLDDPRVLSEQEMDKLMFVENMEEEEDPAKWIQRTFREELQLRISRNEEFPQLFASME